MGRIKVAYEVITEESASEGDVAEQGWEDEKGFPVSMSGAIKFLKDAGPLQCQTHGDRMDCRTLDAERAFPLYDEPMTEKYYTYFVSGFTGKQLDKILDKVDFWSKGNKWKGQR